MDSLVHILTDSIYKFGYKRSMISTEEGLIYCIFLKENMKTNFGMSLHASEKQGLNMCM